MQRPGLTITEVAQTYGVTVRALRHYEDIGLIAPDRTPGNARLYSSAVTRRIETIVLMRAAGIGLADIVASYRAAEPDRVSAELLQRVRKRLSALEAEESKLMQLLHRLDVQSCRPQADPRKQ